MKPINFETVNVIFQAKDCYDLPAVKMNGCLTSLWELTDEERFAIAMGGNIWLCVHGEAHPPVVLSVEVRDE